MSTFNTTELAGNRTLVSGSDDRTERHQVILDSAEFNYLRDYAAKKEAQAEFDITVEEFYKTLTDAADKLNNIPTNDTLDDDFYFIEGEEVEGVAGVKQERTRLQADTVILRLIAEGKEHRLIWVGDTIEVLKAEAPEVIDNVVALPVPEGTTWVSDLAQSDNPVSYEA